VRVAVEKIDGVQAVEVRLNDGVAAIRLAPENRVSLAEIRRVIRDKGFTPKDAEVRVTGRVEARGDRLVLVVPGSTTSWTLQADVAGRARLAERSGQMIEVTGRVPEDDERGDATVLEVRSISAGF